MKYLINREDLEASCTRSYVFEGYRYGATSISLHLTDLEPGQGPLLHRHPYEEVFVVHEGQATYTVGEATTEVSAGQIVLNASRQVLRGNDTMGKSVQKIEEKEGNCDSPNDITRVGCSNACRPPSAV